ncbi:MAG: hypothetical protein HYT16_00055 [DPANN group archaeon]|nr:hypothetical protein [DPANN group archaeon]
MQNSQKLTFNLKFRDDAAQYFALLDFLQKSKIKFAITNRDHLRIVEYNERFADTIDMFMQNDDVNSFAKSFAQASGARIALA